MKKTVAIVGFSELTLSALRDSQADEIWTMNHAYVLGEGKIPRIDRCFEMHHRDWYLRKELPGAVAYWEWLKSAACPIVMQDVDPEIPSSVRYPYEEIVADLFSGLKRGEELNPYFTSSVSFMLALAVYEKWDRVEIYGIEMATGTEYGYQKPGGEFMIGLAVGRGVEVVLHPLTEMCRSHIYAYDGVPNIPRPRTQELYGFYQEQGAHFTEQMHAMVARHNAGDPEAKEKVLEASAFASMYDGAIQVLGRLMENSDYYLSQQNLEGQFYQYKAKEEYWKGIVNEKHSAYNVTGDLTVWQEYLDARAMMYANSGAVQVIKKLMDECELKIVAPELRLTIKDG